MKIIKTFIVFLILFLSISIVNAESVDDNNENAISTNEIFDEIDEINEVSNNINKNNSFETNESDSNNIEDQVEDVNNASIDYEITQSNQVQATQTSNTYYVNINTGADDNPGTQTRPFKTFEYSITQTHNNDKLILADGNYRLTKKMNISYNLTITGTSRANTIVNCPNGSSFDISGGNFRINTMTFRNGYHTGYAGVFTARNHASFYAYNVLFENNRAKRGGVIYNGASSSKLVLTNCVFNNNKAIEFGGAVCSGGYNNTIIVTNCSFTSNQLNYTPTSAISTGSGGAIYSGGEEGSLLTVVNSNFTSNTVKCCGGAIYSGNMAELVVKSSRFNNNRAYYTDNYDARGGAISIGGESLNVTSSNFTNNYAFTGGAISVNSGKNLNIHLCQFTSNNAKNISGAVYMYAYSNISNSNFTSNSAEKRGGALLTRQTKAKVNITNSIFRENYMSSTNESMGGAFTGTGYKGRYIIKNTTFLNNKASSGGALYVSGERTKLYVYSSTFNGNNATSTGGTLYNIANKGTIEFYDSTIKNGYSNKYGGAFGLRGNDSEYIFDNVTMTNNKVNGYGGAIYLDQGDLSLFYSTIKNNVAVGTAGTQKPGYGGALYSKYAYATSIEQTKIQHNNALYGGAIYLYNGSSSGMQYMNVSQIYNNTNKAIYSPNIFFNATRNWWGKNNGNTTINTGITETNKISVREPIVLNTTLNTSYSQTTNKTIIKAHMTIKFYNSSGTLNMLDQFMDKLNIRYKFVNQNTNTTLTDTTFNLTGEKLFTYTLDGDLRNSVYYNLTIIDHIMKVTPTSRTIAQQININKNTEELFIKEENIKLDIIDEFNTIKYEEYILKNIAEENIALNTLL